MKSDSKPLMAVGPKHPLIWVVIILAVTLGVLFFKALRPGFVMFSNDGPLGALVANENRLPASLSGLWVDLNWLGSDSISPPASISSALRLAVSPFMYAKILCPTAIFLVGLGAFYCFRRLRLSPWACILGAIAAALNSDFFSTSCWGVAPTVIGFAAMYAAVGFLAQPAARWSWIRAILAGMAIGVGVMESYDIGALFSIFLAGYALYQGVFLTGQAEALPSLITRSVMRTAIMGFFALLIAAHTITGLIGTQIVGIAGAEQDPQIKQMEWMQKTAWSQPPGEIIQVFVPGVFGYRQIWHMYETDQPTDYRYWGSAPSPIGTGYYASVLVVLVAIWTILQSFRTRGSPFTILQRRSIWFWTIAAVIAVMLAVGKYAPFYQFIYRLPYFSTIRSPQKFMHIFSWALVIIFGYGVHGIAIAYLQKPVALAGGWVTQFKSWRAKAQPFERNWFTGCIIAIVIGLVGLMLYAAAGAKVEASLEATGMPHADAAGIANFSRMAVVWFVGLLIVATGLLALIFSGQFTGPRARWGGILMGLFLLLDLGRADAPWIVAWDVNYKYAKDPIVDFLAEKPYEHRVSFLPFGFYIPILTNMTAGREDLFQPWQQQLALMANAYNSAWKQNLFPYQNIQCIDDIQEPRVGVDKQALKMALPDNTGFNILRWWELSSTRYILGPGPEVMKRLDPTGKKLVAIKSFDFEPKKSNPSFTSTEDWVSVENPNGHLSIIDYADALPRAKLFTQWLVSSNDESTLQALGSPAFDPHKSVLVANAPVNSNPTNADKDPGTVQIMPNYKSKRIEMEAEVKLPSVLLLTDRYNSKWQAEVDGKPAPILRANYIMRGVYLEPGKHTVVMQYIAPKTTLLMTLALIALGLLLWGFVALCGSGEETAVAAPSAAPAKAETKKP